MASKRPQFEQVIQLAKAGCTVSEIACSLNMRYGTVRRWCIRARVKPRRAHPLPDEVCDEVLRLACKGVARPDIARALNISAPSVTKICQRANVELKPGAFGGMYTDSAIRSALKLRQEGYTWRHITEVTGISYETLRRRQKKPLKSSKSSCVGNNKSQSETPHTEKGALSWDMVEDIARMGKGQARLGINQRIAIAYGLQAGKTRAQIAKICGCAPSTITREINRHTKDEVYDYRLAQEQADAAAKRPKPKKLETNTALRDEVVERLKQFHSPEAISKGLENDYPDNLEMHISHETIYRNLTVDDNGALVGLVDPREVLRRGRKKRVAKSRLEKTGPGKSWTKGHSIDERPKEVEGRREAGHWEGDLVIGGDLKSALITLVERTTRYLVAIRVTNHLAITVVDALKKAVGNREDCQIESHQMKTLTWDQGAEMALHEQFSKETNVKVYFCHPHCPWEKGTDENTNGLIRQYFPKGTDFSSVTDEEVRLMQKQLNTRPRQVLGGKTPQEVFDRLLVKGIVQ